MRVSTASLAVVAGATMVSAQVNQTYLQELIGALNSTNLNLTGLLAVLPDVLNTTEGQGLFNALPGSNKTFLAPSNEAFANVSQDMASNASSLAQTLSYHILNGSVTTLPGNGTHALYRSFYQTGMLPGNATEPVVFVNGSTKGLILEPTTNATIVSGPFTAVNLMIYVIDRVLTLPMTISELAPTLFPSLVGVLQQAGILQPLESVRGITVFAPNDAAISAVSSSVGSLNNSQLTTLVGNHVINGSVVYSTQLRAANYTSAEGEPFVFVSNSTGMFVTSGQSTARIVQSDIIIANGVVHLIDGFLVNPASNSTAASAAQSSYAAAATATTSSGGAIGSATATGSGATPSATKKSAAQFSVAGPALLPITAVVAFMLGLF